MQKGKSKFEGGIVVYIDTIPDLLRHSLIEKQEVAKIIRDELESRIDDVITRLESLPGVMIHAGEYCILLREARQLFIHGYFYSCVAMCGITAERIVKDIFSKSLLVISDSQAVPPNEKAIEDLKSFGAKDICDFLINAGILDHNLRTDFKALGELRNKYTHAGGKAPEKDAQSAISHLHRIITGTVSVFKDVDIREGKLAQKREK